MPCSQFSCFGRHRMVEDASDLMNSPKFSRNDSQCRSLFILVETDKAGQFQWIIWDRISICSCYWDPQGSSEGGRTWVDFRWAVSCSLSLWLESAVNHIMNRLGASGLLSQDFNRRGGDLLVCPLIIPQSRKAKNSACQRWSVIWWWKPFSRKKDGRKLEKCKEMHDIPAKYIFWNKIPEKGKNMNRHITLK